MSRFAEVVLPIAVDKAFTYLIPPDLEQTAVAGVRVIVPFGRSYAEGLIIGLSDETQVRGIKPLKDVIDRAPVMSAELLSVCSWVADYYMAPLGEVLKAAIPAGFSSPGRRMVTAGPSASPEAVAGLQRSSPRRAEILSLVLNKGPLSTSDLQKKIALKSLNAALHEMEREGFIELQETLASRKRKSRTVPSVILRDINPLQLSTLRASLPAGRKSAARLLSTIQSLLEQGTEEIPVAELLKSARVPSSVFRRFNETGLLPLVLRRLPLQEDYGTEEQTLNLVLNQFQRNALDRITAALETGMHQTFLLHGVTGSGKTQVYIEAIRHCLVRRKTAIVLVPEISLTPQTVRRFNSHFPGQVAVLHSKMSAGERRESWQRALLGECTVVIGPRSAVFSPLRDLGLLVVDEEQESSYKQFDSTPRYHARDVAIVRGSMNNAVVLLGSATPSVESYANAGSGKYELLEMPVRIDTVPMPKIVVVDMTAERRRAYHELRESLPEGNRGTLKEFQQSSISGLLRDKITDRLAKREGIILLQNRRGFAPFVECPECGYTVMCDNCSVTLIYHLAQRHLRCHYCGMVREPLTECPQCRGRSLKLVGIGTQRVEQELQHLFPDARLVRMDVDTTSQKGSHAKLLRRFGEGGADILLGTQMVAKGLDFPRVTLVGVISADTQMLLPDFRASERTFQLLTQVAGRAGRSVLTGEVVIQTHQPGHPVLHHVVDHNFRAFFDEELAGRRELLYPPFSRLVLIETRGKEEARVRAAAEYFAQSLRESGPGVIILGPAPAAIARVRNHYRWHVIAKNLKSIDPAGTRLRSFVRTSLENFQQRNQRSVQVTIDVDPAGLM